MAVKKSLDPKNTGAPAEYWRITNLHLYFNGGVSALVELEGYASAKAKSDGRSSMAFQQVTLPDVGSAIVGAKGDVREAIYPLLCVEGAFLEGGIKE